ncbi:hypothetical protein ASG01_08850 [Chryseobacterium sp. Leaf180]|jgi:hypothetical protein|uniref:hypothetical protein n=1 Tax=Chryseobacterium sp. Leaf180 TaxID=1736289 RepID=UPI0006F4DB75|nr:hypothetical protein [Chryseobacterium sp. Leaf180]KQR93295.1 hypothetical protein ASG01_08850 [Chryseobacterium sp. Leaf180]
MLRELNADPEKRFFIYHINENGLRAAIVPKGENPNDIAVKNSFMTNGKIEWFSTKEHPCLYE